MSTSQPPFESRVPELKIPEHGFQSTLPQHLLEGADPQTIWLLNEISKNTQATEFACRGVVELSLHLRALNGKTYKNESSNAVLKDKVEVLEAQALAVAPFYKPLAQFAALWEYRAFRYLVYAAAVFFFSYLLPYYILHPLSIETVINKLFGP